MSIPGYATPQATHDFLRKISSITDKHIRTLGHSGLNACALGFGTYRCHADIETHSNALKRALKKGCNLIDTSANYTDGNAEVMIGSVLNSEIVWGDLSREAIIIVSKVGYIQGENMDIAMALAKQGNGFPDVVKYQDGLWHCIHPRFIEDQITRSLARMHLDTLDVYLLHNPEYYLTDASHSASTGREAAEQVFYTRIKQAFIQMEKLVAAGLIRSYGISSNGFPLAADQAEMISLARTWLAYKDACLHSGISAADGHFSTIQLPFNWIESGAAMLKNNRYQNQNCTVLELAKKLGLSVLVNRPLNAIQSGRLIRLARQCADDDRTGHLAAFTTAREHLASEESAIRSLLDQWGNTTMVEEQTLGSMFNNAANFQHLLDRGYDVSHASMIIANYFNKAHRLAVKLLLENVPADRKSEVIVLVPKYEERYARAVNALLLALDAENYLQVQHLEERFDAHYPELGPTLSLSQKSLIAADAAGVDVVLNGMRTPAYVDDSMAVLGIDRDINSADLLK